MNNQKNEEVKWRGYEGQIVLRGEEEETLKF